MPKRQLIYNRLCEHYLDVSQDSFLNNDFFQWACKKVAEWRLSSHEILSLVYFDCCRCSAFWWMFRKYWITAKNVSSVFPSSCPYTPSLVAGKVFFSKFSLPCLCCTRWRWLHGCRHGASLFAPFQVRSLPSCSGPCPRDTLHFSSQANPSVSTGTVPEVRVGGVGSAAPNSRITAAPVIYNQRWKKAPFVSPL